MSWWDTSNLTNLASSAIKNAQKKIDKALEISEDASKAGQSSRSSKGKEKKSGKEGDFWSAWLGSGEKSGNDESLASSTQDSTSKITSVKGEAHSSWSAWGLGAPEESDNTISDKQSHDGSSVTDIEDKSAVTVHTQMFSTGSALLEPDNSSLRSSVTSTESTTIEEEQHSVKCDFGTSPSPVVHPSEMSEIDLSDTDPFDGSPNPHQDTNLQITPATEEILPYSISYLIKADNSEDDFLVSEDVSFPGITPITNLTKKEELQNDQSSYKMVEVSDSQDTNITKPELSVDCVFSDVLHPSDIDISTTMTRQWTAENVTYQGDQTKMEVDSLAFTTPVGEESTVDEFDGSVSKSVSVNTDLCTDAEPCRQVDCVTRSDGESSSMVQDPNACEGVSDFSVILAPDSGISQHVLDDSWHTASPVTSNDQADLYSGSGSSEFSPLKNADNPRDSEVSCDQIYYEKADPCSSFLVLELKTSGVNDNNINSDSILDSTRHKSIYSELDIDPLPDGLNRGNTVSAVETESERHLSSVMVKPVIRDESTEHISDNTDSVSDVMQTSASSVVNTSTDLNMQESRVSVNDLELSMEIIPDSLSVSVSSVNEESNLLDITTENYVPSHKSCADYYAGEHGLDVQSEVCSWDQMKIEQEAGDVLTYMKGGSLLIEAVPFNIQQNIGSPSEDLPLSDALRIHVDSIGSVDTTTSEETIVDRTLIEESEHVSSDDSKDEGPERSASANSSSSTGSSFVKDMLEEAITDSGKLYIDTECRSQSSSDKSSDTRRSEFCSPNGHESDISTTTSSDIEIISIPTPNGDKDHRAVGDFSPMKISLTRSIRNSSHHSMTHQRTDSQSSSSTYSKPDQQMSPGRDSLDCHELMESSEEITSAEQSRRESTDEHGACSQIMDHLIADNPYQTEKLLKTFITMPIKDEKGLVKKLAQISEVLLVRETKLVSLSKENNDLMESNSILRNQLQQAEEAHAVEMTDLTALTDEFTIRIGETDKKVQGLSKDKESLKKQLEIAHSNMGDKSEQYDQLIVEKDEQISELMQEGEKLSKQQLQSSTIIKKLRAKEKESDTLMQSQKKKLEDQKTELEHLKKVLDSKEEMEEKQSDAISHLNSAVQKNEKDIQKFMNEAEDHQEKIRSMQGALDASYKEIADLHKANAVKDSHAYEAALSADLQARDELKLTMERENQRYRQEKESLVIQIEDLRLGLSRMEKEHARREDMLRQEISDLQQRLQEDEARNQELTQTVCSATRPLLRQIENLQSTYNAQSTSWERVEKNITDRLVETQNQLAVAIEKERSASEKLLDLNSRQISLESQTNLLRQDKSQLTAQLEMERSRLEVLQDQKNNETAQLETVKQALNQEIATIKREKLLVDTQLDMEKNKVETEKKKNLLLQDQLREKDRETPHSRGTPSPVPLSVSRQESIISVDYQPAVPMFTQEDFLERRFLMSPQSPNGSRTTLYETLRQAGAVTLIESLQSKLKQREGEIVQLQSEIGELENTREAMARELVNLTSLNDDLHEQVEELPELRTRYQNLEKRYNALLQMYGEKEEEATELRMDLHDVKDMYKAQIDHLLKAQ